jgi:hypothetical protein
MNHFKQIYEYFYTEACREDDTDVFGFVRDDEAQEAPEPEPAVNEDQDEPDEAQEADAPEPPRKKQRVDSPDDTKDEVPFLRSLNNIIDLGEVIYVDDLNESDEEFF